MSIKITILNDNRPLNNNYCSEHGLSVHISFDGISILLDTGQTDKFAINANTLDINLNSLSACIISHGHYDHTGGLQKLAQIVSDTSLPLYIGQGAEIRRYSLSSVMMKENGIPDPQVLKNFQLNLIKGVKTIQFPASTGTITLFTLPDKAPTNPKLVTKNSNGDIIPDTFADELFTLIQYKEKRILFGGCTHHGLFQLLTFCQQQLNINHINTFIGGLHLSGKTPTDIKQASQAAQNIIKVDQWIVNHCTGEEAISYWQQNFNSTPQMGFAGYTTTIQTSI